MLRGGDTRRDIYYFAGRTTGNWVAGHCAAGLPREGLPDSHSPRARARARAPQCQQFTLQIPSASVRLGS